MSSSSSTGSISNAFRLGENARESPIRPDSSAMLADTRWGGSTDAGVSLGESAGAIFVQCAAEVSLAAGEHAYSAQTHFGGDYSAVSQLNLARDRSAADPEDKPGVVQIDAGRS